MEMILRKLLRIKFVRFVMLFLLVIGGSALLYGGCNNSNDVVCFPFDDLDLGLADDQDDCDFIAGDFLCEDTVFDEITGDCQGIDCLVCEDGSCDLNFEAASNAECGGLADQFECFGVELIGFACMLEDCALCPP